MANWVAVLSHLPSVLPVAAVALVRSAVAITLADVAELGITAVGKKHVAPEAQGGTGAVLLPLSRKETVPLRPLHRLLQKRRPLLRPSVVLLPSLRSLLPPPNFSIQIFLLLLPLLRSVH
ncbi:hypothetical protein PM082_021751 [Marasmius tenuissimus]|nr:hypothetical protein PM082_021751 [Marasmius tenuissimus]